MATETATADTETDTATVNDTVDAPAPDAGTTAADPATETQTDTTPPDGDKSADATSDETDSGESSTSTILGGGEEDEQGDNADDQTAQPYDSFEIPEGFDIDETLLEQATPVFRELGLDQEQAQKIVDLHLGALQASSEAANEIVAENQQKWLKELESDKDFGGTNAKQTRDLAQKAARTFLDEEATQFLNESGLGNYPPLVKAFARIGRLISEDGVIAGNENAGRADVPIEERVYPNMVNKK